VVLGRKQRQRRALAALGCGEAEVIEERGDVRDALIQLVPEAIDAGVVEVARHRGGLPAARRAGDPRHRALALGIEQREQALARQDAGQAWTGNLAEGGAPLGLKAEILCRRSENYVFLT
jgi:hypothetical protein